MTFIKKRTLLLLLSFSILLSSCGSKKQETPPARTIAGGTLTVEGIVVSPQPLDNFVRSSGTVLASESVDLAAEVAGRVEKIAFAEGAHVKKGDLLIKINDDDLQAQLKKQNCKLSLPKSRKRGRNNCSTLAVLAKNSMTLQ